MSHKRAASLFTGFLIGGVIGAGSVLLLAQQSGEETRSQIRDKGIELKEKTETTYAQVREKLETTAADLKTRLTPETRLLSEESETEENDVPTR